MVKMALSAGKNLTQISIFEFIYQPFELKIQSKLGLFRSKSSPKNLWKSSKQLLEVKNIDFWCLKWSQFGKMTTSEGQNLNSKSRFWWSSKFFRNLYHAKVWAFWVQKQCTHNFKSTSKQLWKKTKFDQKIHPTCPPPPTHPSVTPQIKATDRSGINSKK